MQLRRHGDVCQYYAYWARVHLADISIASANACRAFPDPLERSSSERDARQEHQNPAVGQRQSLLLNEEEESAAVIIDPN